MSLSMYDASVPVFVRSLTALSTVLDKAAAYFEAKKIDPAAVLTARLAPDMFALTRQVQLACDFAKNTSGRLAGGDLPKYEDTETSITELKARIQKTLAFITGLSKDSIDGSADRDIVVPLRAGPTTFKGKAFLLGFGLPNFFFHATTAYVILRHNGLEIGKTDFLGAP